MKAASLSEILQDCLERVERGASPEEALAAFPDRAAELRPLLEAAVQAHALRAEIAVPRDAQLRSRIQFIEAASRPRKVTFRSFLRGGWPAASIITALALVLGGTGFASAQSLPGDQLYPVKIAAEQARLQLVSDPAQRLQIKAGYDRQRVDEVESLLARDPAHPVEVDFAGFLARPNPQGDWMVGSIRLVLPIELANRADLQVGRYVDVHGAPIPGGRVQVESITPRVEKVSGPVQAVQNNTIQVDRMTVDLTANTHLSSSPAVGDVIEAEVAPREDGSLQAVSVDVAHGPGYATATETIPPTTAVETPESSDAAPAAHSTPTSVSGGGYSGGETETQPSSGSPSEQEHTQGQSQPQTENQSESPQPESHPSSDSGQNTQESSHSGGD